jgi:hypothetical protein
MKIKRKKDRKTVLVLDDREVRVLSDLVDDGFDDHFQHRCGGNRRLKVSRIAAEFFDKLKVLTEIQNKTAP